MSRTFVERLKELFVGRRDSTDVVLATPAPWVSVFKSKDDGRTRVLMVYSNNFKDRENQIVSEAAHKEYVEAAEEGRALYPDLHLWHAGPETKWGTIETVDYTNGFAIAGGVVDEGRESVALKVKEMADKGELAVSFGFYGLIGPDGVYHLYRPFEISPLPVGSEANPYTGIDLSTLKESSMPFSDKKKNWLKQHFGMDDARVATAEQSFENMSSNLKALGIDYKEEEIFSQGVVTAAAPAAPQPQPQPAPAPTPQPAPPPAPAPQPAPPQAPPPQPGDTPSAAPQSVAPQQPQTTTTNGSSTATNGATMVVPSAPVVVAAQDTTPIVAALGELAGVVKALKEQVDKLSDPVLVQKQAEELVLAQIAGAGVGGGYSATRVAANVKETQQPGDDWLQQAFGSIGFNGAAPSGSGAVVGLVNGNGNNEGAR